MSHSLSVGNDSGRFDVLDGWRGLSILLVLSAHLLPVGPKKWELNSVCSLLGMAIFFTLSGFLITSFLLKRNNVVDFLIRRTFRIVPLVWVFIAVALFYIGASSDKFIPHLLFYANLPPFYITKVTSHLWSVCVEMQFYFGIALIFGLLGARGLMVLPILAVGFTILRVSWGVHDSIVSWFRIDEILAGCTLSLAFHGKLGSMPMKILQRLNPYVVLAVFTVACHPLGGFMNYLRPYFAAILVGVTMVPSDRFITRALVSSRLKYVAEVSFALYVIHPLLANTWLGSGGTVEKYLKRPLLFAAIFGLAHFSTFQFEHRCIATGKRLSNALRGIGKMKSA